MHNVAPASLITKIFGARAQPARVAGPGAWQPGSHVHNHRCAAAEEQSRVSLPHWRGQCICSFLPPLPSHLSSSLQLSVSLSLRCQLSSSRTAASQHLLQPSAPAPTCSPCPLITPAPPQFLLCSWLCLTSFFSPDLCPGYTHHLCLNSCFQKSFRLSDAVIFFPLKTSGLTKCGHKRKNYILNLLSKSETFWSGRKEITT